LKVRAQVSELRSAVEQVSLTIDKAVPLYSGLFFRATHSEDGKGKIEMFSMKMGAKCLISVPAVVEETGACFFRPEQLLAGLKGQDGADLVNFVLASDRKRLACTCGKSRFRVSLMSGEGPLAEHIKHLPLHGRNGSHYSATILADVIKKALWCASMADNNPSVVDALEFKRTETGFKVFATDGSAAVRVTVKTGLNPEEMTIPKVPFEAMSKMLGKQSEDDISIIKGEPHNGEYNELYFRWGSLFFGASTAERKLPNIEAIFADSNRQPTHVVIVSRTLLKNVVDRVAGFADRNNPVLKLELDGNRLIVSAGGADGDCVDEFEIAYAGDSPKKDGATEVNISYSYLSKVLASITNDLITVGVRDDMSPLIVADEGSDADVNTRYMVMCVRPKDEKAEDTDGEEQDDEIPD
jgi:DNA polymerase III sliding clamp (beta) subunit (PCNA family)